MLEASVGTSLIMGASFEVPSSVLMVYMDKLVMPID